MQTSVTDFLKQIRAHYPVVYLSDGICKDGQCHASEDGVFIYRDFGHLSYEGSAWLGQKMDFYQRLTEAAKSSRRTD
jgi:hypothetical protein